MPRSNKPRTTGKEANLAERIAFERERRGLSYEALAKLMTDAGCSIQGSALYRIEKGSPPRRISVDELVTLAEIWETTVDDLLRPMDLVEQQRANELIEALQRNQRNMFRLAANVFDVFLQLAPLIDDNPDLLQYVKGHYAKNPTGLSGDDFKDFTLSIAAVVGYDGTEGDVHREVAFLRVLDAAGKFHGELFGAAGLVAAGDADALDAKTKKKLLVELAELRSDEDGDE